MKKAIYICLSSLLLMACKPYYFRSNYKDANALLHETANLKTRPYLKAHLKNGDVYILRDTWKVDTALNLVNGNGIQYDFNRSKVYEGALSISVDSVAIFETNQKILDPESGRVSALSILAGADLALTTLCLSNPKACFGSCPTFYLHENDDFHYADAEGFSNAISPSLEYADIDALQHASPQSDTFFLTMKNEALETHCVRDVKLLACPRQPGERVYQTAGNNFYRCRSLYPVSSATADEGDVTPLLNAADLSERFSLSDPQNLSSKEEIILQFETPEDLKKPGLILDFRQTLMTTYFIYSAMGYMGDQVGDIFARLESNRGTRSKLNGIKAELGAIDIYLWNPRNSRWEKQSELYETGPIAVNRQFVPLSDLAAPGTPVRLKLVLNKGLWRLDYAALTHIVQQVEPLTISPVSILNKGKQDDAALQAILRPDQHLISMPGSAYKFRFMLPPGSPEYELFVRSEGYYLEWMRAHWIKDKNLLKLKQMIDQPNRYLRQEAAYFKEYEQYMEQEFWNSRIDTKNFSYYEN